MGVVGPTSASGKGDGGIPLFGGGGTTHVPPEAPAGVGWETVKLFVGCFLFCFVYSRQRTLYKYYRQFFFPCKKSIKIIFIYESKVHSRL